VIFSVSYKLGNMMHCVLNGTNFRIRSLLSRVTNSTLIWDTIMFPLSYGLYVNLGYDPCPLGYGPCSLGYSPCSLGICIHISWCVSVCCFYDINFLLHDLKASSFSIPRLYAIGLGDVSVLQHEVTYIWQCCFFVLLSKMPLFYAWCT
jgi:hypothetical protein